MLQKTSHFHARGQSDRRRMGAGRFRRDDRRDQSGDGPEDRHRAEIRQGRNAPRHRSGRGRFPDLAQDRRRSSARKLLRKLHDAIMDNQQPLAELLTTEQGKSLAESKGEIAISAAYVLWFAEEGAPHLWRRRAVAMEGPPHPRHQGAGRRHRGDHAVEFPVLDAVAQDRRRRLPPAARRSSSRPRRRPIRASPGACCARRSASRRAWSTSSPARPARSATRSAPIRWSGSSPSPARPRSARC